MQLESCLEKLSTLEFSLLVLPIVVILVLMYENVKLSKKVKDKKDSTNNEESHSSSLEEYVLDLSSKGVEPEHISEQLNISVSRVDLIIKFSKLRD